MSRYGVVWCGVIVIIIIIIIILSFQHKSASGLQEQTPLTQHLHTHQQQ